MPPTAKARDPLPAEFASSDELAAFWDTHDLTDYADILEPVAVDVAIEQRHYEIEVDHESFLALRARARQQHRPVKDLASELLKRTLKPA